MFWSHEARPNEPEGDGGLLLGRVTLDFDNFQDKHGRYNGTLRACIAHQREGGDESSARVIEAAVDRNGYFAVPNLPRKDRYALKEIKSGNFTVGVPFQISSPITSAKPDAKNETYVHDLGYFAVTVNSEGKISCEMTSPDFHVTKKGGESGSQIRFDGSTTTLDRHDWFERAYPDSGWQAKVAADRRRIERDREEKARKEDQPGKPAPSPQPMKKA